MPFWRYSTAVPSSGAVCFRTLSNIIKTNARGHHSRTPKTTAASEHRQSLNQTLVQDDEWERPNNIMTPGNQTLQQVPFDHVTPGSLTGAFVRTDVLPKRRTWLSTHHHASLGMSRRTHAAWHSAINCWSYKNICWARGTFISFHFRCRSKNNEGKWCGEASLYSVYKSAAAYR